MRCGYSESEHHNSASYSEALTAELAAHKENWAKSPENIFKEMLATQEASVSQAWAKAHAIWNNEDGLITHFHLWPLAAKRNLLRDSGLLSEFRTSSGPVSYETAEQVQGLLLQFEAANNFKIQVQIEYFNDTHIKNAVQVIMTEPACTEEQVFEVFK
jgi:hypothetical protein